MTAFFRLIFCTLGLSAPLIAVCQADTVLFELTSSFAYSGTYSAFSGVFHPSGNVLYTANKELGLVVFQVSESGTLSAQDTFPNTLFHNLKVSNLDLADGYLYASLGDFQGLNSRPGLAIMELGASGNLSIVSVWDTAAYQNGSAIVKVQGDYAYLGAMDDGLLILNVADKNHPYLVSRFLPDVNFPTPPGLFSYPHARGLALRGDFVFLCNDAGGFRVINVANKSQPIEVAQYVNAYIEDHAARAYNHVALNGDFAFIGVDYCGVETLNISDPTHPVFVSHFNPWDCSPTNWENGQGHANELVVVPQENMLFLSAGDSELLALDISNPALLNPLGTYGSIGDSAAVWGLQAYQNRVALFYINNASVPEWVPQPFYGDFGGLRLLEWDRIATEVVEQRPPNELFKVFPNPFYDDLQIDSFQKIKNEEIQWMMLNHQGQVFAKGSLYQESFPYHLPVNWSLAPAGLYFLAIKSASEQQLLKIVKR